MEEEKAKKRAWYQVKIEELEAKVKTLEGSLISSEATTASSGETASIVVGDGTYNEGYANGFFDCMGKYGVLSKLQRRRIKEMILAKGPGSVKATKRTRFSLSVPSL